MRSKIIILALIVLLGGVHCDPTPSEIQEILKTYNENAQPLCTKSVTAEWDSNVDIDNEEKLQAAVSLLSVCVL